MCRLLTAIIFACCCVAATACDFSQSMCDSTLRIDIKVIEDGPDQGVYIDSLRIRKQWHGRRANLDRMHAMAALTLHMIDNASGDTIFVESKYLASANDEPVNATLLAPCPKHPVTLEIGTWYLGHHGWERSYSTSHSLCTDTVPFNLSSPTPYITLRQANDPHNALNLAIVAEGYSATELPRFLESARALDSALFVRPEFEKFADRFNVIAVMSESSESGISRPSKQIVRNTALKAHFDSYSLDRLITLSDSRRLWNIVDGLPAQFIMILVNTADYGGSGPYNEYAIASADNSWSEQIIVHEFGHSFANLGDEYEEGYDIYFSEEFEPGEPNITTLCTQPCKWQDLIDSGKASLIEGAGYQSKGVWRGCQHCLMRALPDMDFCPVCARAISRTISFYTD